MARRLFIVGVDDSGSSTLAQTLRSAGFTCVAIPSECAAVPACGPPGDSCLKLDRDEPLTAVPPERLAGVSAGAHGTSWGAVADDRNGNCGMPGFATRRLSPAGLDNSSSCEDEKPGALVRRYERLSEREREVAGLVVEGLLNKQISAELGIAERTVKIHRARTMNKLEVRSLPDLVRYIDRVARVTLSNPCRSNLRADSNQLQSSPLQAGQ